jgi:leucyl-tRNA synthetase
MFAYPSRHAHVGHVRNYIIGDVMARTKRMRGYNVLHPFGWDVSGCRRKMPRSRPARAETSTLDNIAHMKGQLQRLGSIRLAARDRHLPARVLQVQPVDLPEDVRARAGLPPARPSTMPSCNTVLANEQVIDGACWRCGSSSSRATSSSGSSASPSTPTSS